MNKIIVQVKKGINKLVSRKSSLILIAAAVVAGVMGVVWLLQQVYQANLQRIDTSKYQVVYLVNGQAYFGKLQNTTGNFIVLKSPYIAQSIESAKEETPEDASTQTTILKVTDQIYGPEDSIAIKSTQIAFWQNLRDDSKVAQAIKAKE